jgi:6,7-dimethyl-8-ribityllumazine synthase
MVSSRSTGYQAFPAPFRSPLSPAATTPAHSNSAAMAFVTSTAPLLSARPSAASTCASSAASGLHGSAVPASRQPRRRAAVAAAAPRAAPTCNDGSIKFDVSDGSPYRIGIVWTRWNREMVGAMVADVKDALAECKVQPENVVEMQVPGAFELPMAARLMCSTQKVDAVVAVGALIKGETDHYEYIAGAVANGLMDLQLSVNVPCIFGVLTCPDRETAEARSIGDKSHAVDWGKTAVEMAILRGSQVGVTPGKKRVGF